MTLTATELKAIREKAEAHWEFLEMHFHRIFIDAYLHGYKHGKEETE